MKGTILRKIVVASAPLVMAIYMLLMSGLVAVAAGGPEAREYLVARGEMSQSQCHAYMIATWVFVGLWIFTIIGGFVGLFVAGSKIMG